MSKSKHKHKIRHGKGEREREREREGSRRRSQPTVSCETKFSCNAYREKLLKSCPSSAPADHNQDWQPYTVRRLVPNLLNVMTIHTTRYY